MPTTTKATVASWGIIEINPISRKRKMLPGAHHSRKEAWSNILRGSVEFVVESRACQTKDEYERTRRRHQRRLRNLGYEVVRVQVKEL